MQLHRLTLSDMVVIAIVVYVTNLIQYAHENVFYLMIGSHYLMIRSNNQMIQQQRLYYCNKISDARKIDTRITVRISDAVRCI